MKKFLVLFVVMCLILTGCGTKALDEAKEAVVAYNAEAAWINDLLAPYNEAAQSVLSANSAVTDAINQAQDVINKGEEPYDQNTLVALKDAMIAAQEALVPNPEIISPIEMLEVNEGMKSKELKAIKETATAGIEKLNTFTEPTVPEIPDYSEFLSNLAAAKEAYEDSVQGLKQITAPTDEFVMSRLQRIDTITEMGAVTEDHDPNNQLNKQGGYIGCIYFRDIRVDKSRLVVGPGEDINDVIDVGTMAGGAIEIFANVQDATGRDNYMTNLGTQGLFARAGSHVVAGTLVVRTSDELKGSQQKQLTEDIINALIAVDK